MNHLTRRSAIAGLAALVSFKATGTSLAGSDIEALTIMTEEYPPFNYRDGDQLRGISVDIILEICKRANTGHTRADIALLPWARGYNLTLQRPGHALFSTTRTQDREELFKWVGPFVPTVVGLTAAKERNVKINSIDDLYKLRIGVVKDDIGQLLLQANGMPEDRMEVVLTNEQNYRKLIAGRVDAISYETEVTKWGLKQLGRNPLDYEIIHELKRAELHLALHRMTPDAVVTALQIALNSMVADGTYEKILNRYRNGA